MAYRKIKEICKPFSSSILINKMKNDNGDYPLWGAKGLVKKISTYQQDKPYISIVKWGAGVGRVEIRPEKTSIVATMQGILPNSDIDIRWLCNALRYLHLENFATKATVPNLYFRDYGEAVIRVPDTEEQKFISSVLEKIKIDIDKKKHIIDRLDNLIKARFVEMFGDVVKNDKNWPTKPISSVAPASSPKIDINDNVWLLNLDMVEAQSGKILDKLIVSKDKINASTCAFDAKNVLYSKLRPYLNKVVLPDQEGYCTTELVPLKPDNKLNREFLATLLRSDAFVGYINEKTAGAKMPRVSMNFFRQFECILPPIALQEQFSAFYKQIDKSKFTNLRPTTNLHHAIYFLCATFTFTWFTIAYFIVVSICECPSNFCTCSIGIPLSIARVAIVLRNLCG